MVLTSSIHLHIVSSAGHARCSCSMLGTEANLEVLEELSRLLVNVCRESNCRASLDRATLGEDRGQIDVVRVDLERLLALAIVDSVHGHGDEAVARHLQTRMSFTIKFIKQGRATDQYLVLVVVVARHLAMKVTISEPDLQLV